MIEIDIYVSSNNSSKSHQNTGKNDSKIISGGLKNNTFKWEVAEVFLIRQVKPSLTVQETFIALDLFN